MGRAGRATGSWVARRSRRAGAALALVTLLGLVGLVAAPWLAAALAGRPLRYQPAGAAARPAGDSLMLRDALSVRDFDGDDVSLFLLDPLAPAVLVLRRAGDGWLPAGSFGGRGGGPGEFSLPTGIALLRDGRVAVAEPGRLHFFRRTGEHLESRALALPCALALPQVAAAGRGLFVHGSCLRAGGGADTMLAVLFWSADGDRFRLVASDARFTTDGSFGSGFGPDVGFTDGESHHLFGAGTRPCVYRVLEGGSAPLAERHCDAGARPHRLELSERTRAALEAQARRRPLAAGALRIPASHSSYVERLVLPAGDAWLRGYSEDSLVVRLVGDQADIAVLPYHGLIGCRRSGCLYARAEAAGVRVRFLSVALLDSLARAVRAGTTLAAREATR